MQKYLGWILIIALSLSPLIPWYLALDPFSSRFSSLFSQLTSIGQMTGLVGMAMFSLTLVLSARLKVFENFFGGMNRVYVAHHIFGGISLILLLIHPLFLAASYATFSLNAAALYILPGEDWTINLGISSLMLLISLLVLTFYVNLPYQIWELTHRFLGAIFLMGGIHALFVPSDISRNTPLKIYVLALIIIGLLCYFYRTVFGRFLVRRSKYKIDALKMLNNNIIEIKLSALNKPISFQAGQFIFISFKDPDLSPETHPFSLSSSPGEGNLSVTAKFLGDYTSNLKKLTVGTTAVIEGSFGRFSFKNCKNKVQIWIAGGIGITPFYSMAKDLAGTNYIVDLYYSIKNQEEGVYLNNLIELSSQNPNLKIFPVLTETMGFLTADIVAKTSGDLASKDIFLCGPPVMMKSLRYQLRKLKLKSSRIHSEEFQIL